MASTNPNQMDMEVMETNINPTEVVAVAVVVVNTKLAVVEAVGQGANSMESASPVER